MKFLVFLGTVRNSTPPKPARLGERVVQAYIACKRVCKANLVHTK